MSFADEGYIYKGVLHHENKASKMLDAADRTYRDAKLEKGDAAKLDTRFEKAGPVQSHLELIPRWPTRDQPKFRSVGSLFLGHHRRRLRPVKGGQSPRLRKMPERNCEDLPDVPNEMPKLGLLKR